MGTDRIVLVKIDLDRLAMIMQVSDERKEVIDKLKSTINNLIIDKEVGVNKELLTLREENASLKQEKKNSDDKLHELYKSYVSMEKVYTDYIEKRYITNIQGGTKLILPKVEYTSPIDDINSFLQELDIKV